MAARYGMQLKFCFSSIKSDVAVKIYNIQIQLTTIQTIHFGFRTALVSRVISADV
jgi:hypothetical protein